jgi:hypothetical protein
MLGGRLNPLLYRRRGEGCPNRQRASFPCLSHLSGHDSISICPRGLTTHGVSELQGGYPSYVLFGPASHRTHMESLCLSWICWLIVVGSVVVPTFACAEKWRLLRAFIKAVSDLNRIHSAQMAAVLNGEGFLFQEELEEALGRKETAKYAAMVRQQEHGC